MESPRVELGYLDFQSSAPTAYANFPYVLGGNFIERYATALSIVHSEGQAKVSRLLPIPHLYQTFTELSLRFEPH